LGLVAVIVGPMAISELNKQQAEGRPEEKGRGMAIAGIVTGIISLVLTAVALVWLFGAYA
jgi:hypothetical protein